MWTLCHYLTIYSLLHDPNWSQMSVSSLSLDLSLDILLTQSHLRSRKHTFLTVTVESVPPMCPSRFLMISQTTVAVSSHTLIEVK